MYIFQGCQNFGHLKFTRPLAGDSQVVSQKNTCGVCVSALRKKGVSRSECGMQPHSHISHFELMKWCIVRNVTAAIRTNWKVECLFVRSLESKDHTYSAGGKEGFFCRWLGNWKVGLPFEVSCVGVCGLQNGHKFFYCPVSEPNPSLLPIKNHTT